jgi:hypothetical protein
MNLSSIKDAMTAVIDSRDVMVFGGIALAGFGFGLIFPPIGLIFTGLMLTWLGLR